MSDSPHMDLSRRERQIMFVIYKLGSATVQQVMDHMPDTPSNSTVRTLLRLLEEKGHLRHQEDGPRYVYFPTKDRAEVRQSALRHLLKTFFDNSTEKAMAALLDLDQPAGLTDEAIDRIQQRIDQAKDEGR